MKRKGKKKMNNNFNMTKIYIDKLEKRIQDAVNYITDKVYELKEDHMLIVFDKEKIYHILNILRGEDNE